MAIIKPFKALRPQPEKAAQVATLPYDVMNTSEARKMAAGNPHSFLHVSRAEIDFPEGTDEHSPAVYERASDNLQRLINEKVLIQDASAHYYIYAQTMNGRRQNGLVACSSVEDYFNDVIKKHEFTRPEKEQDRIEHMMAVKAHVGPIFLTYPHHNEVDSLIAKIVAEEKPVYDFVAEDGITHTVWLVNNENATEQLTSYFANDIPFTYIADGHHRTASAAKVGKKLREENPNHTDNEAYNFFLSVLFPDNQLVIMDYNRVVKDLNGLSEAEFLERISEKFETSTCNGGYESAKPQHLHDFGMYLNGQWYSLKSKPGTWSEDPIGVLDVSIITNNLLDPILGIKDQRTDKRIDFVGGIRGLEALEQRVNRGEAAVAFALYPVSIQQLIDIADSGNVMPPKSTWFEPKLRDGLFCHLF